MSGLSGCAFAAAAAAAAGAIAVAYRGLENLVHGAAHDDVCQNNRQINDVVGDLLFGAPVGQTVDGFRYMHLRLHHAGFAGEADPCAMRMRGRDDVQAGQLPTLLETMRRVPAEAVSFARLAGVAPANTLRALAWQGLAVFAPVAATVGIEPALAAYAATMPLALGVMLPALRATAEAGEHDYRAAGPDLIVERTYDNTGFLNTLLHPFGDGYHILHHFAPQVPQHRLARLTREITRSDPSFAGIAMRRRGVLSEPRPYCAPAPKTGFLVRANVKIHCHSH